MRTSTTIGLAILLGCASSGAQAGFPEKGLVESPESNPAQLTDDTLKQMLTGMGYEPKALHKGFLLAIKQDTWTINMQVVLSPDQNKMGMNANLGKVEDTAAVPASTWLQLLISNGDIDPSAFYYDKDQKKLYLHRSFDNRGITPAILRREIDSFSSQVRSTEDLWKFTK
jgi:hypothetical protein